MWLEAYLTRDSEGRTGRDSPTGVHHPDTDRLPVFQLQDGSYVSGSAVNRRQERRQFPFPALTHFRWLEYEPVSRGAGRVVGRLYMP